MLYRSWDSFTQACITLCDQSDRPTRTCIRWRQQIGLLVIKVTDDKQTLTFKTRSGVYLNRFDTLNRQLLRKYANKRRATLPVTVLEAAGGEDTKMEGEEGATAGGGGDGAEGATGASGPAKKKKSKGKKKNK
ncbi:hypothetical protein JCM10908_002312 [Rhodotorula pacifica]|uniref:uncharacterized protein n=1 Tax=Rhodotorula pacifica TaxID=1495444 RepID=UPI00317A3E76